MFGSHLSISGGLHKALLEAEKLGVETVQIFTANPRCSGLRKSRQMTYRDLRTITTNQQWQCPALEPATIAAWKQHCRRLRFTQTVSHDSYLINLASPDEALWRKSIALFIEELTRCVALGIPYLVTHPGAHMESGEVVGLARVAAALDLVHAAVPSKAVLICLEVTAGQGTSLGYRLEHLTEIISRVKSPDRLGVCLDTAHLFAGGYDFRGRRYAGFRRQVEATVGLDRVKVLHLNDSKKPLGSRVDRHEHIGHGTIGQAAFRAFVRDEAFAHIPKILETPKEKAPDGRDWDLINLEALRSLL